MHLFHEHLFQSAKSWPNNMALGPQTSSEQAISYKELTARVDSLAKGIVASFDTRSKIAICASKSIDTIIIMLACLRAGMPYVPVDFRSPIDRQLFVLKDSGAKGLYMDGVTVEQWRGWMGTLPCRLITAASDEREGPTSSAGRVTLDDLITSGSVNNGGGCHLPDLEANDIAYIIYTSGSTGDPKGVVITYGNASAFVDWGIGYFDLRPEDRVAVHAPLHFDLPIFDIYVSLATGAAAYLIDDSVTMFPEAVLDFLKDYDITVMYAVPSALTSLANRSSLKKGDLPYLRLLLYAGEEFHLANLKRLMGKLPDTKVYNLYGPVETNVVTVFPVNGQLEQFDRIPIGAPVDHAEILLVDEVRTVIEEPDVEGEILVHSPSVTPGYLNRSGLTDKHKESIDHNGKQLTYFRTGDYGKWDENEILHFVGRKDELIKTRGFRVELGEIETLMYKNPHVAEAAVIAEPNSEYTNLIIACVVLKIKDSIDDVGVINWCRKMLPTYMVPQRVYFFDQFPRTGTGKVSKRRLGEIYNLDN